MRCDSRTGTGSDTTAAAVGAVVRGGAIIFSAHIDGTHALPVVGPWNTTAAYRYSGSHTTAGRNGAGGVYFSQRTLTAPRTTGCGAMKHDGGLPVLGLRHDDGA